MIAQQIENTVEVIGDIRENQIRLDQENTDHILAILSSNLYSNPEESFLRETISNAVDSHIEAGTEEPVILSFLAKDNCECDIVIRDYGTGISPEKFTKIYLSIGASTKRDSNEYIGHFGIGRFSALACADIVHITSFYEGKAYYYLMVKNGSKINIDLVSELDTEEHNGVEIKISTDRVSRFADVISNLVGFNKLYIHYTSGLPEYVREIIDTFNNRRLTHYKTFITLTNCPFPNTSWRNSCLMLGSVVYPFDMSKVDTKYDSYQFRSALKGIFLRFNIGDLDITPNREQLLYSERTIKKLNEKLEDFIAEVNLFIAEKAVNEKNLFTAYYATVYKTSLLLKNDFSLDIESSLFKEQVVKYRHNNNIVKEFIKKYSYKRLNTFSQVIKVYYMDKFLTNKALEKSNLGDFIKTCIETNIPINVIVLPNLDLVRKRYFKMWAYSKYTKTLSVFIVNSNYTRRTISTIIGYEDALLYYHVAATLKKYMIFFDDALQKEFEDFVKTTKTITVKTPQSTVEKSFYAAISATNNYSMIHKKTFESISLLKRFIADSYLSQYPILYGSIRDTRFNILSKICEYPSRKYILVQFYDTTLKKLKTLPANWIPIEKVVNGNMKEFRRYLTYRQFYKPGLCHTILKEICDFMPSELCSKLKLVLKYRIPFFYEDEKDTLETMRKEFIDAGNNYEVDMIESINACNKYSEKLQELSRLLRICKWGYGDIRGLGLAFIAMKKKLIRLDNKYYQKTRIKDEQNN